MSTLANVAVHPSQSPEMVRSEFLESLRRRQVNHKFHYDSFKQTRQWLALHQAFSPSRRDADCAGIYDRSFEFAARQMPSRPVHVIGLGCGGGQKDTRLLRLLHAGGPQILYSPCDVSLAMVLVARNAALSVVADSGCLPLLCDLAQAQDLPDVFDRQVPGAPQRLFTFFGMIPNFEPHSILAKLAAMVRPHDRLLFSANLSPGTDYAAGMRSILPQYDNPPTRQWLMTFLLDLGVENTDGNLRFGIEDDPERSGLKRIIADFEFARPRSIQAEGDCFRFVPADTIRLFFSYRHTPERVRTLLGRHGLKVAEEWIAASGEEGVFFCGRQS